MERTETQLEHGCLSCTVRLDVVPTVERLLERGEEMVIIGLPPAVSSETAIGALRRGLPARVTVDSAVLACAPDTLEDHIWDQHTLFESGFTPVPEDHRTPGEFLIGELCFNDTVLLAEPALVPVDPALRRRGIQLIRELAPHADVVVDPAEIRPGRHDYQEAQCRTVPGSVRIPAAVSASPFTTVTHRAERPLHPERFRDALASLAEGCCWLRGRLWIAAAPRCRIAIQGIGPLVWLENTGPWLADRDAGAAPDPLDNVDARLDWHPEHGDRCSVHRGDRRGTRSRRNRRAARRLRTHGRGNGRRIRRAGGPVPAGPRAAPRPALKLTHQTPQAQPPTKRSTTMKVRNSLRALKKVPGAQIVRRRGRTFVINKKDPRMKARQG